MGYEKYQVKKPSTVVLMYPVITMDEGITHAGTRNYLLGETPSEELIFETSVEKHVDGDYPPTLLWCGKNDESVSPENTKRMEQALADANAKHECVIYENAPHGIGPGTGTDAEGWIDDAVRFVEAV